MYKLNNSNNNNYLSSLPLCPLCKKDLIQIENIQISNPSYEPSLEFSCSCLINTNQHTSKPQKSHILIKDYLLLLLSNISNGIVKKCFKHPIRNGNIYCQNCDINMCANCFNYHNSFKPTHKTQYGYKLNDIICSSHQANNCFYYCIDCYKYLCELCHNSKTHCDHSIINLEEYWDNIYSKLKIKGSEDMNKFTYTQMNNLKDFTKDQIFKIDQMINQLKLIKDKIERYYTIIQKVNSNLVDLYYLIFNNFKNCKISPKISLLHNMERISLNCENLLSNNLLLKLNTNIKDIAKNIMDLQNNIYENLNSIYMVNFENKKIKIDNIDFDLFSNDFTPDWKLSSNSISSANLVGKKREREDIKIEKTEKQKYNESYSNEVIDNGEEINITKELIRKKSFNSITNNNSNIKSKENEGDDNKENITKDKSDKSKKFNEEYNNIIKYPSSSLIKIYSEIPFQEKIHQFSLAGIVPNALSIYNDNGINKLIAGYNDNSLHFINIKNFQCDKIIKTEPYLPNKISNTVFNEEILLVAFNDNSIRSLNIKNFNFINDNFIGHSKTITSIVLIPNTNTFITSSKDKTIKLWDITNNTCVNTFQGHTKAVQCLIVYNYTSIISGGDDNAIRIWNIKTTKCEGIFKGHQNAILSIVKGEKSKEKLIISSGLDNLCKVWDVPSKNCIATITENDSPVNSIIWMENQYIITGKKNGVIKILDDEIYNKIFSLDSGHTIGLSSLLYIKNENYFLSCGEDGIIKLWV